jgi:hypothetical protein
VPSSRLGERVKADKVIGVCSSASDLLFSLVRDNFLLRGERRGGGVLGGRSSASDLLSSLVVVVLECAFVLLRGERRGGGDVGVPGMVIWKVSAGVCCVTI